jgi:hypothetical protein
MKPSSRAARFFADAILTEDESAEPLPGLSLDLLEIGIICGIGQRFTF